MNATTIKALRAFQIAAAILLIALIVSTFMWSNALRESEEKAARYNEALATIATAENAEDDESGETEDVVDQPPSDVVMTDANGKSIADLQAYLTSPERSARYEALVPKAGKLIAEALNNGTFGEPYRYNSLKTDLEPGYTGWGGISLENNGIPNKVRTTPFAWVWWNGDGTIGDQPVVQIALPGKKSPEDTHVMIFGPNEYHPYWSSFRLVDGEQFSNQSAYDLEVYGGWGSEIHGNKFTPTTLAEFQQLDDAILAQLDANMVSQFGPDWQNK